MVYIGGYHPLTNDELGWNNPLILTIDPNFQEHPSIPFLANASLPVS